MRETAQVRSDLQQGLRPGAVSESGSGAAQAGGAAWAPQGRAFLRASSSPKRRAPAIPSLHTQALGGGEGRLTDGHRGSQEVRVRSEDSGIEGDKSTACFRSSALQGLRAISQADVLHQASPVPRPRIIAQASAQVRQGGAHRTSNRSSTSDVDNSARSMAVVEKERCMEDDCHIFSARDKCRRVGILSSPRHPGVGGRNRM